MPYKTIGCQMQPVSNDQFFDHITTGNPAFGTFHF